ncbi:MAG: sigma-70 family RNA polymerase sigma factor [Isosphaeraceae bacterium]|nr:sigma-70 family RNA polymerase sigma factor [Isosphaeraceae bacterium]
MASARSGATVRWIHLLFSGKSVVGQSDPVLLRRFVANRDEEAFTALVVRHGPMVCTVCRAVLRDSHAVEDAFQATFLILVRRAGSLRVDESLGGWLYRVAYHVALRASRETTRRRMREQGGADLAAFPKPAPDDRLAAELHDAIARLPERYRRALVLCDLEGMPQLEAARVLHCGEATLRRRLAGARERLRNRLAARGVPPALLSHLSATSHGTLPAGWAATTARVALALAPATAAAMRLAASSARASLRATSAKVLLLIVGIFSAAGATYALTRADDSKPGATVPTPRPNAAAKTEPKLIPKAETAPTKKAETGAVRWVHLKSDRGYECWADCNAGIEFKRAGTTVTMVDAPRREWLSYEGHGPIEKSKPDWLRGDKDKRGRWITPAMHDLDLDPNQAVPSRTPAFLRFPAPILTVDYDFDTLDGKKTIRVDQYDHDALGASRLQRQVWYDAEIRRLIRMKDRYQLGEQQQYGKEFETIDYDYPETGPADMAALGVPRDAKVVDLEKTRSHKWADQSPEVRKAITAQAEAIRKFPRDLRVVTKDHRGTIRLVYWSVSQAFVDVRCSNFTRDDHRWGDESQTRYFRADNHDYGGRPDGLFPKLADAPDGDFNADRVAAWFPLGKSVNTGLSDGRMTYHLTRFSTEPNEPNNARVHVMDHGFDEWPELFDEQWPVVRSRWLGLEALPPDADTPPGMVVIKTNGKIQIGDRNEPYPKYNTLDPAHDWIVARKVTWMKEYQKETWRKEETRAKAFKQLPNGSWYVSLWEKSQTRGLERENAATTKPEWTRFIRVNVKPLTADDFPPDLFNGPAFLEKAKKDGAKIEPN